jgi:phosphatidylinositol-3-phosphatase
MPSRGTSAGRPARSCAHHGAVQTSRGHLPPVLAALALLLGACSPASGSVPGTAASSAAPTPGSGTSAAPTPDSTTPDGTTQGTASSASSGSASLESMSAGSPPGLPRPAHVVIAVFENEDAEALGGAPFLAGLAAQGASFTDAHGVTHPSQPNYLALFSGSTQGVTDDECPHTSSGDNLAAQLEAAGLSFTGYSEGLPAAGYTGCSSDGYARKHNPWVDFPALPAAVNQPFTAMPGDYAQLPTVAVVVPDLCDDMHDCPVRTGDDWARQHLGPYAAWAATHDSLLVVTFDEDEGSSANHIPTFVVGAHVRPGPSSQRIDHYSLLHTLEDMYGLPPLGLAAPAAPLAGIWG